MGYYVRALPLKKRPPRWKLQFVSYRREHAALSTAIKPKKECDIPANRWAMLGFRPAMTREEARARQVQLNSELKLKRMTERRCLSELHAREFRLKAKSAFPELFVQEFEVRYIRHRFISSSYRKSLQACWAVARRVILSVEADPSAWFDLTPVFTEHFVEKAWSPSYVRKILRLINQWGFFVSRKTGRPFLSVPNPRGYERARLFEAYYRKCADTLRKSSPLTPKGRVPRLMEIVERASKTVLV